MAEQHDHSFGKARVEALTDGIFSVVMTILILSLVVPILTGPNLSQTQLLQEILSLVPTILVYVFSFTVLLTMWIGHNNIFRYLHTMNPRIMWLNGIFLMLIGAVPFSTAFFGRYTLEQPAILLYAINFLLLAIIYRLFYGYLKSHHYESKDEVLERTLRYSWFSFAIFIAAIVFSFVSPYISLGFFALMPIFYIYQAFFGMYRQVR